MMTTTMLHTLEILEALDDVSNTYELADRIGIHDRNATGRLKTLREAGYVDIGTHDPAGVVATVRVTQAGRVARDRQRAGLPLIPTLHPDIERATLAVLALHTYGTETS